MNLPLISHLDEIVVRLDKLGEKGRVVNFKRTKEKVEALKDKLTNIDSVVGKGKGTRGSTYAVIKQFLETGRSDYLDDLRRRTPEIPTMEYNPFAEYLRGIYGFGDKKVQKLIADGYTNLAQIVAKEKLNEHQRQGIWWRHHLVQPIPRSEIDYIRNYIIAPRWQGIQYEIAGSYRRKSQISGDIDILVLDTSIDDLVLKLGTYIVSKLEGKVKKATDVFHGIIRISDEFWARRLDIRLATTETWAYKLFYFTGSKNFNIRMREQAKSLGMKLDEFSLKDRATGYKYPAKTEEEIFKWLKLEYVAPENRK